MSKRYHQTGHCTCQGQHQIWKNLNPDRTNIFAEKTKIERLEDIGDRILKDGHLRKLIAPDFFFFFSLCDC